MNKIDLVQFIIIVMLAGAVVLLVLTRPAEIPAADYCEKVHHISHQDYMDCKRAVEGIRKQSEAVD